MKNLFVLLLLVTQSCWAVGVDTLEGRWEGFSSQVLENHHLLLSVSETGEGIVQLSSLRTPLMRIDATFSREDFKYRGGYIEITLHSSEFRDKLKSKVIIFDGSQPISYRATLIIFEGDMLGLTVVQNVLIEKRKDEKPIYELLEQIENATNK